MKKIVFILSICFICLCACTQQSITRQLGGDMTIELPKCQELIMATWKDDNIFYLTKPMSEDYVPVTKTFQESSSWNIIESTVYFIESR